MIRFLLNNLWAYQGIMTYFWPQFERNPRLVDFPEAHWMANKLAIVTTFVRYAPGEMPANIAAMIKRRWNIDAADLYPAQEAESLPDLLAEAA